jgi:hypothetical protein
MPRLTRFLFVLPLCATLVLTACGDDTPTAPTAPTPTAVTETFSDTLNINGARTHLFNVTQTGGVTATLTAVSGDGTVVGLGIGTWNGTFDKNDPATSLNTGACAITIARDSALQGATASGNASVGNFCARVYDVGKLTGSVDYTITVTHF